MKNYNLDEKNAMAFLFSCEKGEPFAVNRWMGKGANLGQFRRGRALLWLMVKGYFRFMVKGEWFMVND
jgi:hypothetical protein